MSISRYAGDRFSGLSSDVKPTNVTEGAEFVETDTLLRYVYAGGVWNTPTVPVFAFAQVRNTDSTTSINTGGWTDIPFGGAVDASSTDFTTAADSITCNFTGIISVQALISQTGSVARSNVGIRVTLNNNPISGVGQSGYIRSASGHNQSSAHIHATLSVIPNDVIRIQSIAMAAGGTVTQKLGESVVTVERRDQIGSNGINVTITVAADQAEFDAATPGATELVILNQ